jgi:hypothetical protein
MINDHDDAVEALINDPLKKLITGKLLNLDAAGMKN